MKLDNVRPNEFTLVSLLQACTELGRLKLGGWIHDFAVENGFELRVYLGTALIDMYSKCGSLEDARKVYDKIEIKNLATWNSMITSLGVHGLGREALALFAQMEKANVLPDAITFVGVLCACVHANNVNEGYRYFQYMWEHYGITLILEHYACMIEIYNHANMKDEACQVLQTMPEKLNEGTAIALLRLSTMPEKLNENLAFLRLNTMPEKLNGDAVEVLLSTSIDDSAASIDEISALLAQESHYLGLSSGYFPQYLFWCFK